MGLGLAITGAPMGPGSGGAAWTPVSLSNKVAWYDAAKGTYQDAAATTPASADSDPIGYWRDISGNAKHVTQATAGNKPLLKLNITNGLPAILWDGTDDFLYQASLTVAQPFVLYAVLRISNTSTSRFVFAGNSTTGAFFDTAEKPRMKAGSTVVPSLALAVNVFHHIELVFNGALSTAYADGVSLGLSGDIGAEGMDSLWVGSSEIPSLPLNGYIAELLIKSGLPSTDDTANMGAYFNTKYALNP